MAIQQILPPERLKDGKYVLDENEKELILKGWNEGILNLKKLVRYVWPDILVNGEQLKGTSYQAKAMKVFLAGRNLAPKTAGYEKKSEDPLFQLKEHEKEFIKNHASELKPMEIAKKLWGDLPLGDLRVKLCLEFYKELPPELLNAKFIMETKDYVPPKTDQHVIARLRDYRICDWEIDKLSDKEKLMIRYIIKYTHTYRFISEMNSLLKREERQFVEAGFLKNVYNKNELESEYIDMYISLSLSFLETQKMRKELGDLLEIKDDELEASRANGKANVSGNIIDAINELRKEISAREAKQEQTIKKLLGDRESQLKNRGENKITVDTLFEAWSNKKRREQILKVAEIRKKNLEDELGDIKSMDALKFEIWGMEEAELLN